MQIAAAGMQMARLKLDTHAHNIARVSAEPSDVDLATEIVGVITARHAYGANARMLAEQAETERSLLDVLA